MKPNHTKNLIVRVPEELHAAVQAAAIAEDRTMSQVVRVALRHYIAQPRTV